MRSFYKTIDFSILVIALGAFLIVYTMLPSIYPESAIRITVSRDEIKTRASHFLASNGQEMELAPQLRLQCDEDLLYFLQRKVGTGRAIRLMADSLKGYWWECNWRVKRSVPDTLSITVGDSKPAGSEENIWVTLSMNGSPTGFQISRQGPPVSVDSARILARQFFQRMIEDTTGWSLTEIRSVSDTPVPIVELTWQKSLFIEGVYRKATLHMAGSNPVSFRNEIVIPPKTSRQETIEDVIQIATFLFLYMLFVVLGLIFLIKRLRSDLVDLSSGFAPGLIVFLSWVYVYYHMESGEHLGAALLGLIITAPFIAGAIWVLFFLGESFAREVWPQKLRVYDELRKKVLTSHLGLALFRGALLGVIYLGLQALMAGQIIFPIYLQPTNTNLLIWSGAFPSLLAFAQSLMSSHFIMIALCLFFLSYLRKYLHKPLAIYLTAGLIWTLVCPPMHECAAVLSRIPVNFIMGIFVTWVFMRFELFTNLVMLICAQGLYYSLLFMQCGDSFYLSHGLILVFIVVFLGLSGYWLMVRRKRTAEASEFVPDYMKRTFQREQLQRELEIARNVQLNFLPQDIPDIPGLDIASLCVPAREVGGDYFDFIRLNRQKLGVVIGDVSGKGIPAAFYMTLTKGLFKSLAANHDSPAQVLIKLNRLFFENAERGVFISMLYCIFDLENRVMTFARAGHNPMIIHRSQIKRSEEVRPPGIAIGLEEDEIFTKTIDEYSLPLQKNDMFLLYTDGLNEAQNARHQEFGEARLQQLFAVHHRSSAHDILEDIEKQISEFTGDAEQHDDMTAVVIRVIS
jgi:sigma-B regulation protein RsbU (phosphoserine phosphatase)